jgi:hypothetical protein
MSKSQSDIRWISCGKCGRTFKIGHTAFSLRLFIGDKISSLCAACYTEYQESRYKTLTDRLRGKRATRAKSQSQNLPGMEET